MFENDHDRFIMKNKLMAQGYEMDKVAKTVKDRIGDTETDIPRETTCFTCRKKTKCAEFKKKSTGGSSGAVSIGDETNFLCDRFEPIPINKKDKKVTKKQVNNMLKAALKGRL